LIRHAGWLLPATTSICLLAIAMIEPAREALLVAPVGTAPLLAACLLAAFGATVTVTSIAVRAQEKHRLAPLTNPLS
jgi:hypothetical protein